LQFFGFEIDDRGCLPAGLGIDSSNLPRGVPLGRFFDYRMFDAPSPDGVNALMRLLSKSKKLGQWLTATKQAQTAKAREERLTAYLRRGRLGEGKEISS
jgi:hypothetical protein